MSVDEFEALVDKAMQLAEKVSSHDKNHPEYSAINRTAIFTLLLEKLIANKEKN